MVDTEGNGSSQEAMACTERGQLGAGSDWRRKYSGHGVIARELRMFGREPAHLP